MTKFLIKSGDTVQVISGSDKGKTGKVVQTFPAMDRVVVEGVNVSKRHLKTRRDGEKGQVVEFSMPIHISNVMPLGADGKPMRHVKHRAATKGEGAAKKNTV